VEYPERLVTAQRAYGPEAPSVEGDHRVRVMVGGKRHVHRVGEVELQRAVRTRTAWAPRWSSVISGMTTRTRLIQRLRSSTALGAASLPSSRVAT
jgi:hypothetical protein